MRLLAKDGIYLPSVPRKLIYNQGMLASGNRADLLIKCPPGSFSLISTALPKATDNKAVEGETIMHIITQESPSPPPECDLDVFSPPRPCCDWPPFERRSRTPTTLYTAACHTRLDPVLNPLLLWQTLSTCAASRWQRT